MKSKNLAIKLEKMSAQLEGIDHSFADENDRNEFLFMKGEVLELLEEMAALAHQDAELEHNEKEEDE